MVCMPLKSSRTAQVQSNSCRATIKHTQASVWHTVAVASHSLIEDESRLSASPSAALFWQTIWPADVHHEDFEDQHQGSASAAPK